jgi:hypothetical protein
MRGQGSLHTSVWELARAFLVAMLIADGVDVGCVWPIRFAVLPVPAPGEEVRLFPAPSHLSQPAFPLTHTHLRLCTRCQYI